MADDWKKRFLTRAMDALAPVLHEYGVSEERVTIALAPPHAPAKPAHHEPAKPAGDKK